jgi:hypothetical protein
LHHGHVVCPCICFSDEWKCPRKHCKEAFLKEVLQEAWKRHRKRCCRKCSRKCCRKQRSIGGCKRKETVADNGGLAGEEAEAMKEASEETTKEAQEEVEEEALWEAL